MQNRGSVTNSKDSACSMQQLFTQGLHSNTGVGFTRSFQISPLNPIACLIGASFGGHICTQAEQPQHYATPQFGETKATAAERVVAEPDDSSLSCDPTVSALRFSDLTAWSITRCTS